MLSKMPKITKEESMKYVKLLLADGYGELHTEETELGTHTSYFISFDEMEAMTPEQREYYGLTADYKFAFEHRPPSDGDS